MNDPVLNLDSVPNQLIEYTPEIARNCAERGARWMDDHLVGWALPDIINTERLDMSASFQCIWGQTASWLVRNGQSANSFHDVANQYGKDRQWVIDHGFDIGVVIYFTPNFKMYEMLLCAWLEQIEKRRAEDA